MEKAQAEAESAEKKELAYQHAPISPGSWYEEIINALDTPISEVLVRGDLTEDALGDILRKWTTTNTEAKRILWTFDTSQYPQVFGFLVNDLEEEGKPEQVALFYQALEHERNRT